MSVKNGSIAFIMWVKDQIEWFKRFFQQASGKPSISSVMKLIVIVVWAHSYIKATYMMRNDGIPEISVEWIIFLSAIIGLSQVANVIRKYTDSKTEIETTKAKENDDN